MPERPETPRSIEKRLLLVYGLGLLALIFLAILSNYLLKEQAAHQATSLIKRTVQRGDFRETILTLNEAKLDYFDAVIYYGPEGNRMFSIPPQLDLAVEHEEGLSSKLLYTRIPIDLYFDDAESHKTGSVVFVFGRLSHVPYAISIWLFFLIGVIPLLRTERRRLANEQRKELRLREESSKADLARRVRHDIRSPLGALQIATMDLAGLPEAQRAIIRSGMERLGEIVSELEAIRGPQSVAALRAEPNAPQSLLALAQEIIQEKRLLLPGGVALKKEFSQDALCLFARVQASEFKRNLSNLIDNATHACGGRGQIIVRITRQENSCLIEVSDNGAGIPKEDLSFIGTKGFTTKRGGTGLGLFYAREFAKAAGGEIQIQSERSIGTTVSLRIPLSSASGPYIESVEVPAHAEVVVLDDQSSTHLSWKLRLEELRTKGAIFTLRLFSSPADFLSWYRLEERSRTLCLIDYDLGVNAMTGLDVVHELGPHANAILVTGHYDSEDVQRQCAERGVRLLPKTYLPLVELKSV